MKFILPALAAALLLSGCTDADWNGALQSVGLDTAPAPVQTAAAPAPAPVAAAPAAGHDEFCQAVAQQDIEGQSYDPATRQRVMAQSFQQCQALYAGR